MEKKLWHDHVPLGVLSLYLCFSLASIHILWELKKNDLYTLLYANYTSIYNSLQLSFF